MSDSSSPQPFIPQDTIICKPTKWFLWRVLAMLLMFSVFAVLFLKDGLWGYREKNLEYYVQKNFVQAGVEFQALENKGGNSEAAWKEFASRKVCVFPDDAAAILPKEVDLRMPWPSVLVDGYAVMKEKGGQNGVNQLWKDYTSEKGWDYEPAEHPMDAGEIRDQFVAAGVACVLIVGALFILVRTLRRTIKADHEALYTQDGRRILYSNMVRIDKRKWDTKGIAIVYYMEDGVEKKAKIDGMVYGQFKEEDGAPAEQLFARVMEHFKGEVLEYIDVENEEEVLKS
jgi:hypothetical protein